jgi:hypothetical protein
MYLLDMSESCGVLACVPGRDVLQPGRSNVATQFFAGGPYEYQVTEGWCIILSENRPYADPICRVLHEGRMDSVAPSVEDRFGTSPEPIVASERAKFVPELRRKSLRVASNGDYGYELANEHAGDGAGRRGRRAGLTRVRFCKLRYRVLPKDRAESSGHVCQLCPAASVLQTG